MTRRRDVPDLEFDGNGPRVVIEANLRHNREANRLEGSVHMIAIETGGDGSNAFVIPTMG